MVSCTVHYLYLLLFLLLPAKLGQTTHFRNEKQNTMVQILKKKIKLCESGLKRCMIFVFLFSKYWIMKCEIMHFILRKWYNALKFRKSDPDDCILDGTTVKKFGAFNLHGATYVKFEMYISIKHYLN